MLPPQLNGFTVREDLSISFAKANLLSLVFIIPAMAVLIIPYGLLYGWTAVTQIFWLIKNHLLLAVLFFSAGTVLHELLHGLGWLVFGKLPANAIQFGFAWKWLTPYAHCKQPLALRPYRIGAALPGLALGVIPALLGIILGNHVLLAWGLVFTLAAAGDGLIIWLTRKVPANELIFDHPSRAGCYVVDLIKDSQ